MHVLIHIQFKRERKTECSASFLMLLAYQTGMLMHFVSLLKLLPPGKHLHEWLVIFLQRENKTEPREEDLRRKRNLTKSPKQ